MPKERPQFTHEYVKAILAYDPNTGFFTWKVKKAHRFRIGQRAGNIGWQGYRHIMIDGKDYSEGRLAWFYMTGKWPVEEIDHRNNKRDENWFDNLREATREQNNRNARFKNTNVTGYKGVAFTPKNCKSRPYSAHVMANGKKHFLGYFATPEEAHKAYCKEARKHHADFFHA